MRNLLACGVLLAACGEPSTWELESSDLSIVVDREPYAVHVLNSDGRQVLNSYPSGTDDGYGSLGVATGWVDITNYISPGYFKMEQGLDPWQDAWTVASAEQDKKSITVTLAPMDGGKTRLVVTHTVHGSRLRVEARLDGGEPRAFGASFMATPDEAFLGFGERFNRVDQHGVDVYSWAEEGGLSHGEDELAGPENPFPNGAAMTYYPVPFFISSRGYGFWLDSTWRNEFNLGTGHDNAWRVWHIGPSLAYEVFVPRAGDERPWPAQLVDQFTERTGRPMLPPDWSFGPRRSFGNHAEVNGVMESQAMRDADLAITGIDYSVHFLPAGHDIGREAELTQWNADMHALGYRTLAYFNSLFSDAESSPNYADTDYGLEQNYFLRDADGEPMTVWLISGSQMDVYAVDFTSPEASAWYGAMFQRALAMGFAGWRHDFGEYVQPGMLAANGMSGEELHNLYPVLYQQATAAATDRDTYYYVRSGYTGASQYAPAVWSGDPDASFSDAEGIPAQVRAGISAGLSGIVNWGSDIGGYKCIPEGPEAANGEMLTRWIQLGAFASSMHDQDACAGTDGVKASLWTSPEAQQAWRRYARLHTRLAPYMQAAARVGHETGLPLIRHLFLEEPLPALVQVEDEFFFGPALLVAPVVQRGAVEREVTLPPGYFLDWDRQELLQGPGVVTLPAPLERLPLLLRDGQLVPLLDDSIDTLEDGGEPAVVGPAMVSDVYDVVGLLSPGDASFSLPDGGTLLAAWSGGFAAGDLDEVSAAELETCEGCFVVEELGASLQRARISAGDGESTAGGLRLVSDTGRRVRWDLYLVTP